MWKIFRTAPLLLLLLIASCSYLEFPLERTPGKSKYYEKEPLNCKN
jgi:hypothetical protein